MKIKVAHLTSAHPRYDTRILLKTCSSLAKQEGFVVTLVVADGNGNELVNNVEIIDVGLKSKHRLLRMTQTTRRLFLKAKQLNCDVYHLHDPELLPIGLRLKRLGKVVIFDMHENTPKQILDKKYLPKVLRSSVSMLYKLYERVALRQLDCVVLAEHSYLDDYDTCCACVEVVLNMPDVDALSKFCVERRRGNELFYLGSISVDRGLDIIVQAIEHLCVRYPNIKMHFVGAFDQKDYWVNRGLKSNHIEFHGPMPQPQALGLSLQAAAGLSILRPLANYETSYSTKIFEYMAIGLPVITSDFALYRGVVQENNCGLCVDPTSPVKLAEAIEYLFENPEDAYKMGGNGSRLMKDVYNWSNEEVKLLTIYAAFRRT